MSLIRPVTFDAPTDTQVTAPVSPYTPYALPVFNPPPTAQGLHFLDLLLTTDRNIAVIARAGAGKTTLLMMAVDAYTPYHPSHQIVVCAYNKPIADEVDEKLKAKGYDWRQAQGSTVHRMGNSLCKFAFRPETDEKKVWKLIDQKRETEPRTSPFWAYGAQIQQLVSLGKQAAVGFFDHLHTEDRQTWYHLADYYDIGGFDSTVNIDEVVTCSIEIYKQSLAWTQVIDFDDMILLPLVVGLRVKYPYDLIMTDEAQDLSPARQALIKKFMNPRRGRLIVVGDPKQSIYGFSGADAAAMSNLITSMNMIECSLTVTWRCCSKVVELAKQIVPDLEAAPGAIEGEVRHQAELVSVADLRAKKGDPDTYTGILLDELVPGRDAILCRNNAPLPSLAYKLIRAGIPAKIEGRKIGEGLAALVQRWDVKTTSALTNKLLDYKEREAGRHRAKGHDQKAEDVEDRVATILEIVAEVNRRGQTDVASVVQFIDKLFSDQTRGCVVLATYHKSKGREWDRVLLFEDASRCPSRAARQAWAREQEEHLQYVSRTRAKKVLVFVG